MRKLQKASNEAFKRSINFGVDAYIMTACYTQLDVWSLVWFEILFKVVVVVEFTCKWRFTGEMQRSSIQALVPGDFEWHCRCTRGGTMWHWLTNIQTRMALSRAYSHPPRPLTPSESDLHLKAVTGWTPSRGMLSECMPSVVKALAEGPIGRYARCTGSERTLKTAANAGSEDWCRSTTAWRYA